MKSTLKAAVIGVLALTVNACTVMQETPPQVKAMELVDHAAIVIKTMRAAPEAEMDYLRQAYVGARGIMIFPGVLKASFIIGGEGGNGVLLSRKLNGEWSQPAFYTMAAGSIGFQIGGQASDVVLLLMNEGAVRSVIEHQGKLGADVGVSVGTIGSGLEASTTMNAGADILAFSRSVGVYGGASVEGAAMIRRSDLNEAYYGEALSPQQIVLERQGANPHSTVLRSTLEQ